MSLVEVPVDIAQRGEVCYGWCDITVGGEWAGEYKALYHQNKVVGTRGGIINRIVIRYYLWSVFLCICFNPCQKLVR